MVVCHSDGHRTASYLSQGLKPKMVSLQALNFVVLGIPPVPVHNKGNVLRYWALLECPDEQLMRLSENPFGWR